MSINIKKSCKACDDSVMSSADNIAKGREAAITYIREAINALALAVNARDSDPDSQQVKDAIANLSVILLDLEPDT